MDKSPNHPRVVVGVDQSVAGCAALRAAVSIARGRGVPLYAIRVVSGYAVYTAEYIIEAFHEALGGMPDDVSIRMEVLYDSVGGALVRAASDPGDLIVVGAGGRGRLRALRTRALGRELLRGARCQVLIVPPPEMLRAAGRSARRLRSVRADVWERFESGDGSSRSADH